MINNLKDGITSMDKLVQKQRKLDKEMNRLQKRKEKSAIMFFKPFESIIQNAYKAMCKIARERDKEFFPIPLVKITPSKPEEVYDYYKCSIISGIYRINPAVLYALTGERIEGLAEYQEYMRRVCRTFQNILFMRDYKSTIKDKNFLEMVDHVFQCQNYKFTVDGREYELDHIYRQSLYEEYQKLPLIPFIGDFRIHKENGFVSSIISLNGVKLVDIQFDSKTVANLKLAGEITRKAIREKYKA